MEFRTFTLAHDTARQSVADFAKKAPAGWHVKFSEPTRTLEQNAAQWPYLDAFSKQLKWLINGHMTTLTPEEWKDILTAAFQGETVRLAMGLDGGVVMLGLRTSAMGKKRFSEWLEFLIATAAARGVRVYQDEEVGV
jgi:hypothetical protein